MCTGNKSILLCACFIVATTRRINKADSRAYAEAALWKNRTCIKYILQAFAILNSSNFSLTLKWVCEVSFRTNSNQSARQCFMEYLISRRYLTWIRRALLLSALAVEGAEGAVPGDHHGCRYTSVPDAGHLHPSLHCGELRCAEQQTAQLSTKLCSCFAMFALRACSNVLLLY